jgi:hypothetical protein
MSAGTMWLTLMRHTPYLSQILIGQRAGWSPPDFEVTR